MSKFIMYFLMAVSVDQEPMPIASMTDARACHYLMEEIEQHQMDDTYYVEFYCEALVVMRPMEKINGQ